MWVTALVIGFAGSLHCLGMCSPLVLAVTNMKPGALLNRFVYNAGRVATYAVLGALVAGAGMILPLHQYQNIVSIVLGVILLSIGLGKVRRIAIPGLNVTVMKLTQRLKNLFAGYLKQNTRSAVFIMGSLNGLLPCGLTLLALTWCLTLKGPLDGMNFMLLFGVGTLPVMLGFTSVLPDLARKLNWNLSKLSSMMIILSGCILIARVFILHAPHAITEEASLTDIILCR